MSSDEYEPDLELTEALEEFTLFRYRPDLSDIEEVSEPTSPVLSSSGETQYGMLLENAVKELHDIIESLRLKSPFDAEELAEDFTQFAKDKLEILLSAGKEEFTANYDQVPRCFVPKLTSLMSRIRSLSYLLSLCFHRVHIQIIVIKLERVRLELSKMGTASFLDFDAALEVGESVSAAEALKELEQSLFERYPQARLYFEGMKLQETRTNAQQCLCWKCIIRHLDENFSSK